MNQLGSFITEYLVSIQGYYIRQVLAVCVLFAFGAVLTDCILKKNTSIIIRSVLAFPVGLCAFIITAYAMIVAAIPFTGLSICAALVLETVAAVVIRRKAFLGISCSMAGHMAIVSAVALAAALVACSGMLPVAISNDTMYYFKRYPESIVFYGGLRDQFDCWLTDTGLGSVVIDTLPSLFGFGETFGIREFFHIDFVAFFGTCVWERANKYFDKRGAVIATATSVVFLVTATPFLILGHWALANMYFMELFFMAAYTVYDNDEMLEAGSILLVALSLLRIEGTIFVVWLALCIAIKAKRNRSLAGFVLIPMIILFGGYCVRIFTQFYIYDNIYLFLTPVKAAFLVLAIAGAAVYIAFVQERLPARLQQNLPWVYIGGLVLGNVLLFIRNSELYIGDLKAFAANLFRQSGWGMFPYFVISMTAVLVVEYVLLRKKQKTDTDDFDTFSIVLTAGFLLLTFIASFGRGDVLGENIGDSGNRVMLQILPLVVMTYTSLFMRLARAK
ncbi:MAG: hypothetical protein J5910_07055 [Lachnospiraceae bacterium]|nr:hypothetical protein [Lachnospiraceae bacterium]